MVMIRDFSGKMNLDVNPWRVPKQDYISALNITRDAVSSGSDLVVSNIIGNQLVSYNGYQPDTTNVVIGAFSDNLKNRVVYFVWNNQGYHNILNYDKSTGIITKIFTSKTDSNGVDILNLQLLYKVNDINIIHRDEDGDLLLWNDAYNRPGQINITSFINGIYGTGVTDAMIRLAKMPPVDEFVQSYQNDSTIITNNLKKKLFQFCYAWGYASGEVSTISPTSKVILPVDAYNIVVDSDPTQNNTLILPVTAGGEDYQFIRIFGRLSLGATWSNWFVIDTLDRDDYAIPPGGNYNYVFLNDGQYVDADPLYMDLLFDYCADKCNAQTLVNGNVVVQGGITEGYDAIKKSNISVQLVSTLIDTPGNGAPLPSNPTINSATGAIFPGTCPPQFGTGVPQYRQYLDITIGSDVAENDTYYVKFTISFASPVINVDVMSIAAAGNTQSDIANDLVTKIAAQITNPNYSVSYIAPNKIRVISICFPLTTIYTNIIVNAVAATPVFGGGSATWKWNANYRFGIVYVDKYGKSNGVVSFVGEQDDPSDFSVTTPDFNFNNDSTSTYYGHPQIPVINASINHIPPDWAVAYYWVRTPNRTVSSFLEYITSEVQQDGNYWYFCIENLYVYQTDNSGFVPTYTFANGDRLRIYATVIDANPKYQLYAPPPADYEIIGTIQRDMTITSGTATPGTFLKVKKPSSGAPTYTGRIFIEIYTPATRNSNTNEVFYEFGESYPIYIDSGTGIHYHVGGIQNQTASQPATFLFPDGDVYYKFRDFYELNQTTGEIDPTTVYARGVMDVNYSDYWSSAVNSNGTAWVIDPNARRLFNPVLARFGQAYQPGTDINGLNRFYPNDFDEYFRDYGSIQRFTIRDKFMRVYQQLRIGMVPILSQILKDQSGSNQVVVSDKLLNPIQYYEGQFGCGDHPESVAYNNYADYFASNMRTIIGRLSQDGLQPISIQNEINNFCVTQLGARDFNYKCYGVFDAYNNLYILAMEATDTLTAQTLVWNEQRNGFESFLSYAPEQMTCLRQLLITFKNGQLYTHDSSTYNNFYGVQYDSSITAVFNDNALEKKSWMNVTELSSSKWDIPVITTNVVTNGVQQQSSITEDDLAYLEGQFDASFKRDINTVNVSNPRINGDVLKGSYAIMQFHKTQPTGFEFLNAVKIGTIDSPLTTRQ